MSDKTAYPLSWPQGWPRVKTPRSSAFGKPGRYEGSEGSRNWIRPRGHSMEEARSFLWAELSRLGAANGILSTNFKIRLDGQPYSGQAQPGDRGAAVYFKLKGRDVSLACDKWDRVEDNVYAIAKHVEALRGQDRWGVGSIEQAFRGYMALPETTASSEWWRPLGLPLNASEEQVKQAYRVLALKFHPDNQQTGDAERFRAVQAAYEEFQRQQKAQ